ncbi:PAS domain-containing protein [Martelella mediterranea]|uniref:PAS domain-containing protein n=1 Tax=Martelella mediterranea TaxID=293089 RepID=UPI001E2BB1AB|nr:PAS domain-containing protein [Martelella mediterranea]MCD1632930.1 PAS domain-containing protein [Martelella mediterranea]
MNRHWEDNRVRLMNSEVPRKADNAQVVQTLNQAPESVLLVNAAGVIELANEAAITFFQPDGEARDLSGTRLASLFDTHGAARIDLALARVLGDEPGRRLEEVRADLAAAPARVVNLSLARMRHRDGVCVVATPIAATAPARQPSMPRVDDPDFGREQTARESARPELSTQTQKAAPLANHMPWNNHARRVAAAQGTQSLQQARAEDSQSAPRQMPPLDEVPQPVRNGEAEVVEDRFAGNADSAVRKTETDGPGDVAKRVSWAPGRRDIYAEFESVKDEKERSHELPLISPAKCLSSAIDRHRGEAISESLLLVTEIDDGEKHVRLDEDTLTAMFEHLVERAIAVSPPYCEARIDMLPHGHEGFIAKFVDIGRGLSEQELDAVFRQPELALGISHTGLVEAQKRAAALGLGFSISSSISSGTTVEITHEA